MARVKVAGHSRVLAIVVLLATLALPRGEALYTKIKHGTQKCFVELMHANEVTVINYKSPDQAPLPQDAESQKGHVGVKMIVVNQRGAVYDARLDNQGRLSFVTQDSGEHRVCFSVEGQSYGQDFRVHVHIEHMLKAENHDNIIKREHLSGMDLRVRQLQDEIEEIKQEQGYFRSREDRFFQTTQSTNTRSQ